MSTIREASIFFDRDLFPPVSARVQERVATADRVVGLIDAVLAGDVSAEQLQELAQVCAQFSGALGSLNEQSRKRNADAEYARTFRSFFKSCHP
jgi:hypothetical protein